MAESENASAGSEMWMSCRLAVTALSATTALLVLSVATSALLADRGPSNIAFTVPFGFALTVPLGLIGVVTIWQLNAERDWTTFRPVPLSIAQVCTALTVISVQHLGLLGAAVWVVASSLGTVAVCLSWTHAREGEVAAVIPVAVVLLVCVTWFLGRADERPMEGALAAGGAMSSFAALYIIRRRNVTYESIRERSP